MVSHHFYKLERDHSTFGMSEFSLVPLPEFS